MHRALVVSVVALGLSLAPAALRCGRVAAQPSPFFQSNEAALTGGAVVARSRDAGSSWYNPAGLGANGRTQLELTATALTVRIRNIDDGFVTVLPNGQQLNQPLHTVSFGIVTPAFSAVRRIRPGLSVGIGSFTVQSDTFSLRNSAQTTLDGTKYLTRLDVDYTNVQYDVGPSVGWQFHPRWRLGASLFGVYRNNITQITPVAGSLAAAGGTSSAVLFDSRSDSVVLGMEMVIGLQWQPSDDWHLGLSLLTPRLLLKEFLTASTVSSVSVITPPGGDSVVDLESSSESRQPYGVGWASPLRATFGAAYDLPRGWVSTEVDFSPGMHNAVAAFRPTWNLRAGGIFELNEKFGIGAGFFTIRGANGDSGASGGRSTDYYGGTVGLRMFSPVGLGPGERARNLFFSTIVALRYAAGIGKLNSIRYDFSDTSASQVNRVSFLLHELSLHAGTGLHF